MSLSVTGSHLLVVNEQTWFTSKADDKWPALSCNKTTLVISTLVLLVRNARLLIVPCLSNNANLFLCFLPCVNMYILLSCLVTFCACSFGSRQFSLQNHGVWFRSCTSVAMVCCTVTGVPAYVSWQLWCGEQKYEVVLLQWGSSSCSLWN